MKILLAILILATAALPIDRPYLHWAVWTVKCDGKGCYEQPKILYNTYTINEALHQFQKEHPDLEIRCVTRDYYYRGCTPWW